MSVRIYCKKHDDVHTLDMGTAVALIYTYQRTLAEVSFEQPLAPSEPYPNEHRLLETLCPKEDIEYLSTPKVRNYRYAMGQHRRRWALNHKPKSKGLNPQAL